MNYVLAAALILLIIVCIMVAVQHIIEIRDSERERRAELRRREDREKRIAEMNRTFTAPVRTVHPATPTKTHNPIVSRPTKQPDDDFVIDSPSSSKTDDDDITRRAPPLTDITTFIPFIDSSAPSDSPSRSSDHSSPSDSSSPSTDFGGSDSGFSGGGGGSDW
jgi:uncharacterized membrane protein YgcG